MAALRGTAGVNNLDIALTTGFSTEGDGDSGEWNWDSTDSTTADNTGTVLAPNPLIAGSVKRVDAGIESNTVFTTLDVRWFGAIPDYASDCSAAVVLAYTRPLARCRSEGRFVSATCAAACGHQARLAPLDTAEPSLGASLPSWPRCRSRQSVYNASLDVDTDARCSWACEKARAYRSRSPTTLLKTRLRPAGFSCRRGGV
jgi:hypothetical protein